MIMSGCSKFDFVHTAWLDFFQMRFLNLTYDAVCFLLSVYGVAGLLMSLQCPWVKTPHLSVFFFSFSAWDMSCVSQGPERSGHFEVWWWPVFFPWWPPTPFQPRRQPFLRQQHQQQLHRNQPQSRLSWAGCTSEVFVWSDSKTGHPLLGMFLHSCQPFAV